MSVVEFCQDIPTLGVKEISDVQPCGSDALRDQEQSPHFTARGLH
jgi:hypothetical protein